MLIENYQTVREDMLSGHRKGPHRGKTVWKELEDSGYEYIPTVGWVNRKNNSQVLQIPKREKTTN